MHQRSAKAPDSNLGVRLPTATGRMVTKAQRERRGGDHLFHNDCFGIGASYGENDCVIGVSESTPNSPAQW